MPNYGYHLARAEAQAVRAAYAAALPLLVQRRVAIRRDFPFEVFAYSGEAALPEQIASIRSFLKHAGRPPKFTVISDGTYSSDSVARLAAIDRSVVVKSASDWPIADHAPAFRDYLRNHPTGKQLAIIMSLPTTGHAFYIDSDVLFFPGAARLADELTATSYLPDCQHSADDRLFRSDSERANPVNTGVLFLRDKLDWSVASQRFGELAGAPNFFTNQTLTQLAMQANDAPSLDPRKFVLQLDDQFVYPDRYAGAQLILRHYVNPVRHKFWNAVLRHG